MFHAVRKKDLSMAAMFLVRLENLSNLFNGALRCFLLTFVPFGIAVSEEMTVLCLSNRKLTWFIAATFIDRSGRNEQYLETT